MLVPIKSADKAAKIINGSFNIPVNAKYSENNSTHSFGMGFGTDQSGKFEKTSRIRYELVISLKYDKRFFRYHYVQVNICKVYVDKLL